MVLIGYDDDDGVEDDSMDNCVESINISYNFMICVVIVIYLVMAQMFFIEEMYYFLNVDVGYLGNNF